MDAVKRTLIETHCPDAPLSAIHAGYHRGRRPLLGSIFYPDIVSIHHLHLHVIVKPRPAITFFKYPWWLPLMWKSDMAILKEVRQRPRLQLGS